MPADHGFVTDEGAAACETKARRSSTTAVSITSRVRRWVTSLGGLKPRSTPGHRNAPHLRPNQRGHGQGSWENGLRLCAGLLQATVPPAGGMGPARLQDERQRHRAMHFAKGAGFNRWADTNNLVILYPQTGTKGHQWLLGLVGLRPAMTTPEIRAADELRHRGDGGSAVSGMKNDNHHTASSTRVELIHCRPGLVPGAN